MYSLDEARQICVLHLVSLPFYNIMYAPYSQYSIAIPALLMSDEQATRYSDNIVPAFQRERKPVKRALNDPVKLIIEGSAV
jgi:hypothetical protein